MLCRLYCYGQGRRGETDTWLLPYCLDRWRKYLQARKVYGYWFDYLEKLQTRNRRDLRLSFNHWYAARPDRYKQLGGMQFTALD